MPTLLFRGQKLPGWGFGRPSAALGAATAETRPAVQGRRRQNPHGPQAPQQQGFQDRCPAQGDLGAGERSDQGVKRLAAFPIGGIEKFNAEWH